MGPSPQGGVPQLSTSLWSQVLNAPQKGSWLPSHTWHLGARLVAGVWGKVGGAGKSAGQSALPGLSRLLSWDFPSLLAQAHEERARFVSQPGIWHVSVEAPRAAPEAPPLLAAPPAQPLAQARQCGHRLFVLPRMPRRRAKALRLERSALCRDVGLGSRIWGTPRADWSKPKVLRTRGLSAPSSRVLKKGPPCPAPHTSTRGLAPLCGAGVLGPWGGAGQIRKGRFDLLSLAWTQVERA